MTASINCPSTMIIGSIDSIEGVASILRESFIKNIAVIDMQCMNSKFVQIKELLDDSLNLKIFHGGNTKIFNDMLETFYLQKRTDVVYVQRLNRQEIVRAYWNYYFKKFPPTISKREGSFGEEI